MSNYEWPFSDDRFFYVICQPNVYEKYSDKIESWVRPMVIEKGIKMRPIMVVYSDHSDDNKIALAWEFGIFGFINLESEEEYDA